MRGWSAICAVCTQIFLLITKKKMYANNCKYAFELVLFLFLYFYNSRCVVICPSFHAIALPAKMQQQKKNTIESNWIVLKGYETFFFVLTKAVSFFLLLLLLRIADSKNAAGKKYWNKIKTILLKVFTFVCFSLKQCKSSLVKANFNDQIELD